MPIYEKPDGLTARDRRPLAPAHDEPTGGNGRDVTTVKEAAAHGSLDDMAEAIVRESLVGFLSEPYWDSLSAQGYRDIGGVGGPGPWSGPIDLDQQTRRQEVQWARTLAAFSPPAKNALRLHRTYVLGQGIPMPTAQDSDVQDVIEDLWSDEANAELCSHAGQAETDACWLTTGELFLALFVDEDDGHLKVRSVEPLDVDTVVTDPDDRRRILYYRVRRHRDAFNFAQGQAMDDVVAGAQDEYIYYPDWANADPERDPYRGQARPLAPGGAVMASFPLNRQGVRGIPELTAAVPWIQSHKRLLEAQSIMAEAKKKIALVKTVKGGPQAVGSAASLEQSSISADFGRLERNPARAPGSTYVKNKGIELEYPDLGTGADDAQRDAEMHAQMIGAATGWGTHYLLMSTEFHRLATAVTMELPTLKMCLEGQQRWLDMLRSVLDYALLWAAKKGKIDAPVVRKHGREVVDWKKAQPAPAKDDDKQEQPQADVREAVAARLDAQADLLQSNDAISMTQHYRRAAALVREMEPQDVIAQARHQDAQEKPATKAKQATAKRGAYQIDLPPVLQRDMLPTIQAIEAAASAGHITPEQAAQQVMLVLGFSEVSDNMERWREWVELKGAQIEQEAQQAQDLAHKDQAIKAGPPGGPAAAGGAGAKPDLPGTQGTSAPSGGLSRNPVAREAGGAASSAPFDDAASADVREAAGAGHWVTIEEEGIATHIFIQGGRVTKGPAGLIGAQAGHLPPGPNRTVTHHPAEHEPAGARAHPQYTEQRKDAPESLSQQDGEVGLAAAQKSAHALVGQVTREHYDQTRTALRRIKLDENAVGQQLGRTVEAQQAGAACRTLFGREPTGSDPAAEFAREMGMHWKLGDASDVGPRTALMAMVARELPQAGGMAEPAPWVDRAAFERAAALARDPTVQPVLRAYVHAAYDLTQRAFKDAGVSHIILERGLKDVPARALGTAMQVGGVEAGIVPQGSLSTYPIQSWTSNPTNAQDYAARGTTGTATVLVAAVPAHRILSGSQFGMGMDSDADEWVVMGDHGGAQWVRGPRGAVAEYLHGAARGRTPAAG